MSEIKGTEHGPYRVTVSDGYDEVLEWVGHADNVSHALHKALDQREEELGGEEA